MTRPYITRIELSNPACLRITFADAGKTDVVNRCIDRIPSIYGPERGDRSHWVDSPEILCVYSGVVHMGEDHTPYTNELMFEILAAISQVCAE